MPKPLVAIPNTWTTPITRYLESQLAIGRLGTTITLRRSQLAYMARQLNCPPTAVTEAHINRWFSQQTWEKETRHSYRSAARGFFAFLKESGDIDTDPAANLRPVKVDPPMARPTPDAAWEVAIGSADPRVDLMVRLAAEAGLRRAEVAQLHTDDLDVSDLGARLLVHGKGDRDRLIPISDVLAARIKAGAAGHTPGESPWGWLFPSRYGGHLSPQTVGELVAQVLPGSWTMHTLRHRFATRAYRASRNLRAVQILLGHASIATTQRYLAVDDDEMRAAMLGAAA